MTKKVLALVVAALGFSTIGAFAATGNQGQPQTEQTATCDKAKKGECKKEGKKCHKGDKKDDKKFDKRAKRPQVNPFNGIELTPDQKQKIDQLKADRKAKREADKKAGKEARKAEREQFNAEVAKILTPDQYNQYQLNCDSIKRMPSKGKKVKAKESRK